MQAEDEVVDWNSLDFSLCFAWLLSMPDLFDDTRPYGVFDPLYDQYSERKELDKLERVWDRCGT